MGRRQNSSIWSFLAVFVGYNTQFVLLRRRFQRLVTPATRKLRRRQNLSIWSFLAGFVVYSAQFFWLRRRKDVIKTRRFGHFWPFWWAIAHNFRLQRRFQRLVTPGTRKLRRRQNSLIWSFLAVFMGNRTQFFLAPGRFQRLVTPGTRKFGRRQNSSIWSFLAIFMGYSTQFFLAPCMI